MIDVSLTLDLRVAAEGVETREQLEFLQRRGCQEGQGLYFSPAVDFESLEHLMRQARPLPAVRPAAMA